MFTRATGLLIVPIWLAAMGWLIAHDVWPGVTAGEPPLMTVGANINEADRATQYTILSGSRKLGTIWSTYFLDPTSSERRAAHMTAATPASTSDASSPTGVQTVPVQREDIVWLDHLPIDLPITPLRVISDSSFTKDGRLDEFTLRLTNHNTRARLHGERFHADFSFTLEANDMPRRSFKLPLSNGGLIADALKPFSRMPALELGQRWRMQVFNPVAAVTGLGERFVSMLVEVTGEEIITTPQGNVTCLVVESGSTKAWVTPDGTVQQQDITLKGVGTIRIVRESTVDPDAKATARRASFSPRG